MPKGRGSQSTQSQSQNARDSSDEEESALTFDKAAIQRRVNEVVKYLLLADQRKVPIKKTDINKNVIKEMSRLSNDIISSAKSILQKVFGIELKEIESKQKSYILVNLLTETDSLILKWSKEDEAKLGLLTVVLCNIFMSGGITEKKCWQDLKHLGIDPDEKHPVFGEVRRLILTDWVRQGFIKVSVALSGDPSEQELSWGHRACAETTRAHVLKYCCEVLGREEKEFPTQFNEAYPDQIDVED